MKIGGRSLLRQGKTAMMKILIERHTSTVSALGLGLEVGNPLCEVPDVFFVVIFFIYRLFYPDTQNNLLSPVSILFPLISKRSRNLLWIYYMRWECYRALIFLKEPLRLHHADEVA